MNLKYLIGYVQINVEVGLATAEKKTLMLEILVYLDLLAYRLYWT